MKKFLYFSVAALALASCSSDDFLGTSPVEGLGTANSGEAIAIGGNTLRPTRAAVGGSEAAEKLHNNFVVYGFKTNAAESEDQKVFGRYNVNYTPGTANTTESNTANWEYVGYTSLEDQLQTIKYWDLSADHYVFSAVSGTGITAEKIVTGATYDKGWTVKIPAGGSLSDLYASDRVVATKAGTEAGVTGKYMETVNLTFRALGTKIRFAMYETVPGYSVHIDKFYYGPVPATSKWANTETNFAINGTFKTANADTETPLTITYYDAESSIENRPKVTYDPTDVTTGTYGIFGANIQATAALGTTSAEATYDQSDKSYTMILPFESTAGLDLYVDYTLTATDNSGEKIVVKHASAKVPTNFVQWKPNFAYTYLFKISDNTNGTTGEPGVNPDDPNDPTVDPVDPTGLFPITFDAVVISDEEDVQETITSVADPSITTYQEGVVITENNEYKTGDIYFENGTPDVSGYKVYEVNNFGTEATTEEVVANYLNNFCVLTEVDVTYADGTTNDGKFIPLSNGTYLKKGANEAAKFTAEAGKTYVITDGEGHYKVVKVTGTAAEPTYTQSITTSSITAADGSAVYKLRSDSPKANTGVLGAAPLLKVYDSSDNDVTANFTIKPGAVAGNYRIYLTDAAIAAGANGTYIVKFNGDACAETFTVGLTYTLTSSPVTVVINGSTADFTLKVGTDALSKAVIKNLPAGVTITESAAGTYTVAATSDAVIGTYTETTVAGQALTINVNSYKFSGNIDFTFNYLGTDDAKTLGLALNYGDADVEVSDMTGINTSVATITKATAGAYTVVPVAPGSYTVSYENTSAVITVNQYTLTPSEANIAKSTGSTILTLKKNNGAEKTVNAATAKVTVKKDDVVITTGFSLSTNGSSLKFANVLAAGTYTFEYTEAGKVVAVATVTVE